MVCNFCILWYVHLKTQAIVNNLISNLLFLCRSILISKCCCFFTVDVMKQIDIPSVFVSEETAVSLKEEYYYEAG